MDVGVGGGNHNGRALNTSIRRAAPNAGGGSGQGVLQATEAQGHRQRDCVEDEVADEQPRAAANVAKLGEVSHGTA